MAKNRSGSKVRHLATDRQGAVGNRRKAMSSVRASAPSEGRGAGEVEGPEVTVAVSTGRGGRGRQGMMAGARDIAQNVGEATKDAAQSTMDTARGWAAGAADAAGNVAGKVRDNPWPTLLIGAGATWLAIDAVRGRSGEAVRERAHRPAGRSNLEGNTRAGRNERGAVSQAVSKVAEVGRAAGGQIEGFVRDRPLLAGAATLGLGMAVGMALPSSITENQVLGDARDKIVSKAKEAAQDTMEKVRDVTETFERIGPFGNTGRGRGSSGRG